MMNVGLRRALSVAALFVLTHSGSATAGDGIFKASILSVRPTQAALGFRAVKAKTKDYQEMSKDELKKKLKRDPIPVVLGPDDKYYMIDHHHQAMAARNAGREKAYYRVEADFSDSPNLVSFWERMRKKHWVREIGADGRPIKIPDGLPKTVVGMHDDPYRSLAYFVREAGGYRKTTQEFAEFQWADYFRELAIPLGDSGRDFDEAVKRAETEAHSEAAHARHLPGWSARNVGCKSILDSEGATP